MCVDMYVYMCIYTYIYVYICGYIYTFADIYIYIYICGLYKYVCVCIHVYEPSSKAIVYAWCKNIGYRFWGGYRCTVFCSNQY